MFRKICLINIFLVITLFINLYFADIIISANDFNNDNNSILRSPVSPYANVSGTLNWSDNNNISHPLRKIRVELYKFNYGNTDVLIASTITSDNGQYSFQFTPPLDPNGCTIYLKIYAGNDYTYVENPETNTIYSSESNSVGNVVRNEYYYINKTIQMSTIEEQAFQISQILINGYEFASLFVEEELQTIKASYPVEKYNNNNVQFANSSGEEIIIYDEIPNKPNYLKHYASWDAVLHEFGHIVSDIMHINRSVGGNHTETSNDIDFFHSMNYDNPYNQGLIDIFESDGQEWNEKQAGCERAWSEGFADSFAIICEDYQSNYMTNIYSTNNQKIEYDGFESMDIENPTINKGEGCEVNVASILWDIYDDVNANENFDNISLGLNGFINPLVSEQTFSLNNYIQNFYSLYPSYKDELGNLLTRSHVSTSKPIISNINNISTSISPIITWIPQGGSIYYPNNLFKIEIYNTNGFLVLTTPYTSDTNYELSNSEWNQVLSELGSTFSFAIKAYQDSTYETGPYISEKSDIYNKPLTNSLNYSYEIYNSNRLFEKKITLLPGQIAYINFTFQSDGYKTFQTFGNKDVKMELRTTNGFVINTDDDSGFYYNSLISEDLDATIGYTLKLWFYSPNTSGDFKITLIQTNVCISDFDDFSNINNNTIEISGATQSNCVNAYVFNSNLSEIVTFTVDANYDSYLYLLDVTSNDLCSSISSNPCVYDDDSAGSLQARIIKYIETNKVYLIIVCGYNPANYYGNYRIEIN